MITNAELRRLAGHQGERCISILFPTHKSGQEVLNEKDKKVFKNLLKELARALEKQGLNNGEIKAELAPFQALLEDHLFWHYLDHGLAVYKSGAHFEVHQLPEAPAQMLTVSDRFYIVPLVPMVQHNKEFYILELNLDEIKFFKADRYRIEEIELDGISPRALEEVVGYDYREKSPQFHTLSMGRGTLIKGHESSPEMDKKEISKFFEAVDDALYKSFLHEKKEPLIIACVEYFYPIYKEVSSYKNLYPEYIKGSRKNAKDAELHRDALQLLQDYFEAEVPERLEKFMMLAGTGKTAQSVENILPAAERGRVEHLILQYPESIFGQYDEEKREIIRHDKYEKGSKELLNELAALTVLTDGSVDLLPDEKFPVEDTYAIAVFRW